MAARECRVHALWSWDGSLKLISPRDPFRGFLGLIFFFPFISAAGISFFPPPGISLELRLHPRGILRYEGSPCSNRFFSEIFTV